MTLLAATFFPSAPAQPRLGGTVRVCVGALAFLLGRLLRWLDAWKDRRHLHSLGDHSLRDMGFRRDQIDDVLRGAVRRM